MADSHHSEEIWKDIPGWEGFYQASSFGRVRSLERVIRAISRWGSEQSYLRTGKVLSGRPDKDGYLAVTLRAAGRANYPKIHQLVCAAFHGAKPEWASCVAHGDGNRANNRPENLRWATTKQNHDDRRAHGTFPAKELHPANRMTREIAEQMLAYADQSPISEIAKMFNFSAPTVSLVVNRKHWTTR